MPHSTFGADGRRWRLLVRAVIVSALVGVAAVLAVSAEAGTQRPQLASVQRAAAAPIGAADLGAPAASAAQSGYVVLKPRDERGLTNFIASVTKPHSAQYHQYLRAGQFAGRFGPSSSTVAAVKARLGADGLKVTGVSRDGLLIGFRGTTSGVESAFNTGLERYRSATGITGEQTTRAISLPSSISSDVSAVIGLNTLVHPEAGVIRPPRSAFAGHPAARSPSFTHYAGAPQACSAASDTAAALGGLTDDQIANSYGATPLYGSGDTGAGVNIGVYELEPYLASDLTTFDECYFGTTAGEAMASSTTTVPVDGGQPEGSGSGESILDIEDVSAMAPGAHIDVYEAPNTSAGALDEYAQMVNDDTDQIITSSWGLCEQDLQLADPGAQQAENYIFEQAAAQGQTVLSAAGDTGDDTCNEVRSVPPPSDQNPLSVDDPASQPYVLAVGGTTLQNADPSNYDETVWNDGAEWGGGGGGISESWMAPGWQLTAPLPHGATFPGLPSSTTFTNASTFETNQTVSSNSTPGFCTANSSYVPGGACRTLPDVSAQADEFTGAVTIYQDGWLTIGGTSSATPIWAGLLALVDSSSDCSADTVAFADGSHPDIGVAGPLLYAVAAAAGTEPNGLSEYADSFHDITVGNNDVFGYDNGTVFPATTGYDLASGLGSPILAHGDGTPGLAQNLCDLATTNTTAPVVSGISPASGPSTGGTSVTVTGSGFGTSSTPKVASVTVGSDVITPASTGTAGSFSVTDGTHLAITTPTGADSLAPSGGSEAPQDGAGPANIVVTLQSGVSSIPNGASVFNYVDQTSSVNQPSVSSVSPYSGLQAGTNTITVYGSGFASGDTVQIGGVAAGTPTIVSPSELRVTVPAFTDGATVCTTKPALVAELTSLGNTTDADPSADNICQTEVVVTDSSAHSSKVVAPLPAYFGALPAADQDGILKVPSGYEMSAVPDEYDYVPAPTITGVSTQVSHPSDYANADPGAYGTATSIAITGTGLSYQTLNWLYFGGTSDSSSQDSNYPAYDDGTHIVISAPTDPNVAGSSGSDPDSMSVTADTTTGALSSVDPACTGTSVDCVTYAGIPEVDAVSTGTTGSDPIFGSTVATAANSGGTPLTITGVGLSDVVGPLEFVDDVVNPLFGAQFSQASQYSYSPANDTTITTHTVDQNPAIVDTIACSASGCSASGQAQGVPTNPGDLILLYPPGNPVITSIQSASGPASGPPLGGTLVTINGENLGCVTSIEFGTTVAEAFSPEQALLDCGNSSQLVVVAPAGTAGTSVPIKLTTVESDVAPGGASAVDAPGFSYDTANPSVTSSVGFGSVNLASSNVQAVTITNPSAATQPLDIEPLGVADSNGNQYPVAASIGGANAGDFSITGDACSDRALAPGASCTIQVQFAPSGLGARSATLDIPWNNSLSVLENAGLENDASPTPDFSVPLSGTGTEPTTTVTAPGTINTVAAPGIVNTVTTPGTTTTVTVTRKITCRITIRWRWVTVRVHGKKRREHRKVTTRSKGCKASAEKAAKPSRKHGRKHKTVKQAGKHRR